MAFRTAEQALGAMRDGRQVYNGGELIDDVTTGRIGVMFHLRIVVRTNTRFG